MQNTNSGTKQLALLIPGLDGTGKLFRAQEEALSKNYRVHAWSYGAGNHFGWHDLTLKLGQATADEPPGSILVIAESFGGPVAIDYVLQYPERVQRLILVNTFPYYGGRIRLRLAHALAPLLLFNFAQYIKDFFVERLLRAEGVPPPYRRHFVEVIHQIDRAGYRRRLRLLQDIDLRPRLHEIAVPTILLAGGRDKIVPSVAEARFMAARIKNARVHVFPEAGHALLLTPGVSLANYASEEAMDCQAG